MFSGSKAQTQRRFSDDFSSLRTLKSSSLRIADRQERETSSRFGWWCKGTCARQRRATASGIPSRRPDIVGG